MKTPELEYLQIIHEQSLMFQKWLEILGDEVNIQSQTNTLEQGIAVGHSVCESVLNTPATVSGKTSDSMKDNLNKARAMAEQYAEVRALFVKNQKRFVASLAKYKVLVSG
ncbi:hypothetical protein F7734_59290 [Scytonema sp. UIC 10036]|uniref:hypothetical protein n=1 Tax=Scytonema sp. UIC 10036 TaxID=2304196 RepID=UPI0012DA7D7E|nr:hypothetical protein [Scytonema sp. UIC 10036]MUH01681.1 hypothetical protein [Scytonema sp. UIC 10036]